MGDFGRHRRWRGRGEAGVEVVEVQDGIKNKKIAASGFAAPDGVIGEQDDVTLAVRDVYDGRLFRDFVRASNHAAEEKILFGGKAKNHARLLIRRGNCPAGKFRQIFGDKELLFVRRAFDGLFRRHVGASLNHIGIGERASAARAR